MAAALVSSSIWTKKWVNGTVLHYYFFTSGSWAGGDSQEDAMRRAFKAWSDIGIGLEFKEVKDRKDAEIRIGFERGAGSWSYLGRDILVAAGVNERTMNIGWDIRFDIDTGIHEIGHTLGFPHEHQNPNSGIVWNEEAVYRDLGGPPNNWSRDSTFHNIIRKIDPDDVQGSNWDPNSIMHYPFKAGMIKDPEEFITKPLNPKGGLSERDREWVKSFYPPLPAPPGPEDPTGSVKLGVDKSVPIDIEVGDQLNISVQVTKSARYVIETDGESDTVMVLFSRDGNGGEFKYVDGDDNSGESNNARLEVDLTSEKEYVLRVRLFWKADSPSSITMTEVPGGCVLL